MIIANIGSKTDNTNAQIGTERVTTSNDIISSLSLPSLLPSSSLSNIQNTPTAIVSPTTKSPPAFHAITDNDRYTMIRKKIK
jgi:hypothetical protein